MDTNLAVKIFVGFLVLIALISGVVGIARIFQSNDETKDIAVEVIEPFSLLDYARSDATVSLTMDGEINGNQDHRAIRINISAKKRTVQIIKGYSNNVIASKSFSNTAAAYDNFIYAINGFGFLIQRVDKDDNLVKMEIKGTCPYGERHTYRLIRGSQTLQRTWGSTCSTAIGTSAGSRSNIERMFKLQVPEFSDFTRGVRL